MNKTKLVIGHEPDFAPLTFMDGNESRGLVIDIVDEGLGIIDVTAEFVPVPLAEHDAAIQTGKIDAVAFKAIIPERERDYDFSAPITTSGAAWFVLPSMPFDGDRPPPGSRITSPSKGPLISQLRRDFADFPFIDVDTYAGALSAVTSGDADCAALNFHVGCYLANRDYAGQLELPDMPFQSIPLGLAFANGSNSEILAQFNRALKMMQSAGIVDTIERRWVAK